MTQSLCSSSAGGGASLAKEVEARGDLLSRRPAWDKMRSRVMGRLLVAVVVDELRVARSDPLVSSLESARHRGRRVMEWQGREEQMGDGRVLSAAR